jgi:WD40 repeat protein
MMRRIQWHPEGKYLAVGASKDNGSDVVLFNRKFTEVARLKRHSKPVSLVAWSPNGTYLVSAGQDAKLFVWDVKSKDVIGMLEVEKVSPCTSVNWCPSDNSIAIIGEFGRLFKWNIPVPKHMAAPFGAAEEVNVKNSKSSSGLEAVVDNEQEDGAYYVCTHTHITRNTTPPLLITHPHTHTYTYIHTHTHSHHTHTHTHTHTHIHTHTHTHTNNTYIRH